MTEQPLPLITFYKGWETYQQSLVETIAPLSSEQLYLTAKRIYFISSTDRRSTEVL